MAEGARTPRKRAAAGKAEVRQSLFVVMRIDALPEEAPSEDGIRIGEQLTVIKVAQGSSSDSVAREHRKAMEADWAKQRAEPVGEPLPEQFPRHLYRVVPLGNFTPGYFAEETRQTQFGTF